MNDAFEFFWGDTVCVLSELETDSIELLASVCGVREESGQVLYLVEFSDGSTTELPADRLKKVEEKIPVDHNTLQSNVKLDS